MPVTRRRAAAAVTAVLVEEERAAAIDISSDSDAGSESGSEEDDEESTSDEDYYIDISDSDGEEGGGAGSEEESESESEAEREREPEQSGVDRGEASCRKIADLLRAGRNLDGIKLVDCKAYLKKNGLSQTGDLATCIERIVLHWRFKDRDPEKIYPRSSFCINCKGDVCRGDTVLFKQKVYEKSGKRHSKCIGKRIVAGSVIKESYGKEKQQHTFTIQVFWSKGVGKLPPLYLLLVKGRNLYRMMTFRQPWLNEADRLKALDEKHSRGDAARRVRALSRPDAAGNSKKTTQKGKHQSQAGRPDSGSSIKKGKKRVMQSSNPDLPTKRSRNEESQASSAKQFAGGQNTKTSRARLDRSDRSTNRARMRERKADSQQNLAGGSHAQFGERNAGSGYDMQASHGYLVGVQQSPFEIVRPQRPPPFREVGNASQPHADGRSTACPHPRMGFQHPNAALAGSHPPAYYLGNTPNQFPSFASLNVRQTVHHHPLDQLGASFAPFNVPQTVYRPRPEGGYAMPQFRYSGGSNGFPR
ncbi:hypothetical protein OsI_26895 [Oryza sativa Indica Group]|uniref:DUF7699 domain-containing protein n=1 Tax=Oryza sativa subsp. indica TaxID=39946 RepID=B8B8L8_ORYSI|nr:hypothetical protein OsI_26895 [Oryza sativa Indica Group]